MIARLLFLAALLTTIYFFSKSIRRILRVINLGKDVEINDQIPKRILTMLRVAIGQGKMTKRPIAGALHIIVYAGFLIVNIEILEILTDGLMGTHRVFAQWLGSYYPILIGIFEVFALAVIIACVVFLFRRNVLKTERLVHPDLRAWPRLDANIILVTEIVLMLAFLKMNAADSILYTRGYTHYTVGTEAYWVSQYFQWPLAQFSSLMLAFTERAAWWAHIMGVFLFINFIPYSKHLHIFFAFPNVYFSKLAPRGKTNNMPCVHKEVRIMMGYEEETIVADNSHNTEVATFGAKNLKDLTWKHILDAYTCTECGRCTAKCPANLTGKKLSPRKIIMSVRDRAEDVSKNLGRGNDPYSDGKTLFDYISPEELWACTTCNQCTEECPLNINHMAVILQMRRYIVMEDSAAPSTLNMMFTNIENNGAPWQYSRADRANWTKDLSVETKA
jgi:heterodisulfide reductase subunit C